MSLPSLGLIKLSHDSFQSFLGTHSSTSTKKRVNPIRMDQVSSSREISGPSLSMEKLGLERPNGRCTGLLILAGLRHEINWLSSSPDFMTATSSMMSHEKGKTLSFVKSGFQSLIMNMMDALGSDIKTSTYLALSPRSSPPTTLSWITSLSSTTVDLYVVAWLACSFLKAYSALHKILLAEMRLRGSGADLKIKEYLIRLYEDLHLP